MTKTKKKMDHACDFYCRTCGARTSLKVNKAMAVAWCDRKIAHERTEWEENLKIGNLRQWINKKPKDHLVTNEDIKIMLGLKSGLL